MAVFDFDFPDNMFDDVLNIFDETAPKMIDEALPIYESAVKSELQPHRDTGELISSIKCKKAKKTVNGAYIGYLTAEGASTKSTYTRENGKVEPFRNYQKALALEYGNSHQPARPFMQSAVNNSEDKVLEKMQEVFNRGIK